MNHFLVFDVVLFSYFFLVGYLPSLILSPSCIANPYSRTAASLLYGTSILCLGAAYVVWTGAPVYTLTWLGFFLALCSLFIILIKIYRGKKQFNLKAMITPLPSVAFVFLSCFLTAEAFLLPSLSDDGMFSTPIHLGVDAAGYGITASYMVSWNGRESLGKDLLRETGTDNLASAKSMNSDSLSLQIEVASEFILKALRWSYPTLIASITELFGFDSVYRVLFRSLLPSIVCIFLLVFCFSREFTKGLFFPTMIAASVLLNCNLLNLALQGQYAQVVSAPLFLSLLYTVLRYRQYPEYFIGQSVRQTGHAALVIGALMVLYNEAIVVFAIFICLVIVLDLILLKKFPSRSFLFFIVSFAVGLIVAWPITVQWAFFLSKHLINIKIAGWWQPHWANPAEILGLGNIYSEFAMHELMREPTPYASSIFWSLMFCAILFFTWKEGRTMYDWSMIGAAITFPLTVLVKTFFIERIHNYQYMKSYTMFLPFLISCIFLCVVNLIPKDIYAKRIKACMLGCIFGLIFYNGATYLYKSINDRFLAKESFYQALQALNGIGGYAVWVHHPEIRTFLFGGIENFLWLNRDTIRSAKTHNNEKIALLFYKDQPNALKLRFNAPPPHDLFENDLVKIIDTTRHLKDFLDDQSLYVDMKHLTTFFDRYMEDLYGVQRLE